MKHYLHICLFALLLLMGAQSATAQTFSKMDETQRNTALIKTARELYRNSRFANYYKMYGDNGKATVTVRMVKDNGKSEVTQWNDVGETQYIVKLYSVANKELESINAVKVVISDKLGKAYLIQFDCDKKYYTMWNTPEAFR